MRGDSIRIPLDGSPVKIADYCELALQYHLTGGADYSLQYSLQQPIAQWVPMPASFINITAGDGVLELPEHAIAWVRAVENVAGGAGDTLTLCGFANRTS